MSVVTRTLGRVGDVFIGGAVYGDTGPIGKGSSDLTRTMVAGTEIINFDPVAGKPRYGWGMFEPGTSGSPDIPGLPSSEGTRADRAMARAINLHGIDPHFHRPVMGTPGSRRKGVRAVKREARRRARRRAYADFTFGGRAGTVHDRRASRVWITTLVVGVVLILSVVLGIGINLILQNAERAETLTSCFQK